MTNSVDAILAQGGPVDKQPLKPMDNLLSRLQNVEHNGKGCMARCPAHLDTNNSLSVREAEDGRVLVKCFAGCKVESIVASLNMRLADLFPSRNGHEHPTNGQELREKVPVTVVSLAADKKLLVDHLKALGLDDLPGGGVGIPYRDASGETLVTKRRTALVAKEGSYWPKGVPLMAYGLDRLGTARQTGRLILVEGESDCWTCWLHDLPALGIPGASAVKVLEAEHLEGIGKLYVVQEPDSGGTAFVAGVKQRLRDLEWQGEAHVIRLDGAKDPNELHRMDPSEFKGTFQQAMDRAEPLKGEAEKPAAPTLTPVAPEARPWPNGLAGEAFHGLAGDVVRVIAPNTEASPAALLINFLVAYGNAVGRGPHAVAEADRHALNLFAGLVGQTAKGRKGSSVGHIRNLFCRVDPAWEADHLVSGLSSGEGLIWAVRDAVTKGGEVIDSAVEDKRLLVLEGEFASVLKVMAREGNTLSPVMRLAWDTGNLRTLTKNSPVKATGAHVSIMGHVTSQELLRYLSDTEAGNGFANRFLWVCTKRARCLPEGGRIPEFTDLVQRLHDSLRQGRQMGELRRDDSARAIWAKVYPDLSEGEPGLFGAVTARAEAQVLRLSALYATIDGSPVIQVPHLLAGLAVWDYAEASARYIFGDAIGDPVADRILDALRQSPDGMSRTEIHDLLKRNASVSRIDQALGILLECKKACHHRRETGGRPVELWMAT